MCVEYWIAIGTWIAAIATATYAFFTVKLWREMRASVRVTQQIHEATSRPWVKLSRKEMNGYEKGDTFIVKIENIGTSPANVTSFNIGVRSSDNVIQWSALPMHTMLLPQSPENRVFRLPVNINSTPARIVALASYTFAGTTFHSEVEFIIGSGFEIEDIRSKYE